MTRDNNSISNTIIWICIRTLINMLLIFILFEGFTGGYYFTYKLFTDNPYMAASSAFQDITIESGSNVKSVADLLEQRGIVEDKYLFMARAYIGKYHNRIMAGTYSLGPGMSADEICRKICGLQSEDAS